MEENSAVKKIRVSDVIAENAQIKADIALFISVVSEAFSSIGIKVDDIGQGASMTQILGKVVPVLTKQMAMGEMSNDAFSKFNELVPIIEKYKHLVPSNEPII